MVLELVLVVIISLLHCDTQDKTFPVRQTPFEGKDVRQGHVLMHADVLPVLPVSFSLSRESDLWLIT